MELGQSSGKIYQRTGSIVEPCLSFESGVQVGTSRPFVGCRNSSLNDIRQLSDWDSSFPISTDWSTFAALPKSNPSNRADISGVVRKNLSSTGGSRMSDHFGLIPENITRIGGYHGWDDSSFQISTDWSSFAAHPKSNPSVGYKYLSYTGGSRMSDHSDVLTHENISTRAGYPMSHGRNDVNLSLSDFIGISLVGRRFMEVNPGAYYVEKDEEGLEINDLVPPEKSKVVVDPSRNIPLMPSETSSSEVIHPFVLQPLFTMKRFDRYQHAPDEDLLAQFVKSHYDEDNKENLYDIIHPPLKDQKIDPESFKIFSETAFKCVKDQRPQRPNIDQILTTLEQALEIQRKLDNYNPPPVVTKEEEGTPSDHRHKDNKMDNLRMSFGEIQSATQSFALENIIGGGGFGKVYKGEATCGNERRTIVAKRMNRKGGQGEHHFLTELEVLYEYKHENIIGLEGYCNEKDEKIIVYEYAPKISLERHLKDDSLTWTKRLKICIDVASGLAFLHGGAPTNEIVIHRDIKCANILLNGDWKAKISDFGLSEITTANQEVISNLVGTDGYIDPLYEVTGHFTEKSDIYSFGVVLFEILYGKLLVPNTKINDKEQVPMILKQIHDVEKLDLIVFEAMKNNISPKSLSTFQMIVSQCLQLDRKKRPTADEVLKRLNKALEFQEDYEIWKSKLPQDYEEIMKKSKSSSFTERKKDLYNTFTKGILLEDDKVWFSLGSNGERNAMVSARKFSYRNRSPHKWQSVSESRFQKVAEMLDISNLMIKIKTTTKYLSPAVGYGVYLVFKFCNLKQVSSRPMYVNLKYRKGTETFHAYFATWKDKEWMMIELDRFINQTKEVIFKLLLESLSPHYYADDAIYIEGIEFQAIKNVQELPSKSEEKFKKSNDSEKLLPLSKMNGKKHLILSARTALCNSYDLKLYKSTPSAESRFQEAVELLPQQVFRINCTVKAQTLSPDTIYACYLVFKLLEDCQGFHCPVEVRDLFHRGNKEAEIVYFKIPSPWNLHDITQAPKERVDGWMEVNVWKSNSDHALKKDFLVNLKFRSYEGTMSGLIVYGLEFRPM